MKRKENLGALIPLLGLCSVAALSACKSGGSDETGLLPAVLSLDLAQIPGENGFTAS
ncbi:hypothetical protein Holit_02364 [Hollandina sp. SP2]